MECFKYGNSHGVRSKLFEYLLFVGTVLSILSHLLQFCGLGATTPVLVMEN